MIKKLWLQIRLWNTGWNPFYSPSLDYLMQANEFTKGFREGFEAGITKKEISNEKVRLF